MGESDLNLSLYAWFKSNPKKNELLLYPNWRTGLPTVLLKHASAWYDIFVGDDQRHPGDGLLYFHDSLLGSKVFLESFNDRSIKPKKIPVYALLFNYLYSFSNEKIGSMTVESESVLTSVLSGNPRLAVPLYEFRHQIDLKAFSQFISMFLRKRELSVDDFVINKDAYEVVEHWLWEAILGFSFPRLLGDWRNRMLNLWAGYTSDAVRRFITLHLPVGKSIISPREMRDYLIDAETLYLDTKSLVGCYSTSLVGECRVPKMSSIGMMQRFHGAENMERLRQQISRNKATYKWPSALTDVLIDYPEWYIPTKIAEVRLRGTKHRHCVGSYADRHFQAPKDKYKVLLLFSDLYTSEIFLNFNNEIVSDVNVHQVRGCYNKDAPIDVKRCVHEIAQKMEKLSADAFCPKRIDLDVDKYLA